MYYYYLFIFILFRGPGWFSRYSDSLRAGQSGAQIPVEGRLLFLSEPYRSNPGPAQPPVPWVTRFVPGDKAERV